MNVIIKREDGVKYKIVASPNNSRFGFNWNVEVFKCEKGKRKYVNIIGGESLWGSNDGRYHFNGAILLDNHIDGTKHSQSVIKNGNLISDNWKEYIQLLYVTKDEIYKAQLKAWKANKPTPLDESILFPTKEYDPKEYDENGNEIWHIQSAAVNVMNWHNLFIG